MVGTMDLESVVDIHAASDSESTASQDSGSSSGNTVLSSQMLLKLFGDQQRYLNHFFDALDHEPVLKFAKACLSCSGVVIFTGVGKSAYIAQKICQTLVSTGTRAMFLNPTDALHGDIGILSKNDLVACFSKSGATEELLRLVPYAKAKGARLVSITCVRGCKLDAMCDMAVHLPILRELCPFDMAPVTSTAVQMIFGDTVAIALMLVKNLTKDEYAMNHPAGRIGRRLMLKVDDVMLRGDALPLVSPDTRIMAALGVLSSKGCGCVLVAELYQGGAVPDTSLPEAGGGATLAAANGHRGGERDGGEAGLGRLLGIFTDGDLRRALQGAGTNIVDLRVDDCMTRSPKTCAPHVKAVEAMSLMESPPKVTAMPVVDEDGNLVGLVTLHGLVSAGL